MLNMRLIVILAFAALVGLAAFVIRTASATSTVVSSQAVGSDSSLREPSGAVPLAAAEASDWYDRHPDAIIAVEASASDWFERHPVTRTIMSGVDQSDYFLRHPTANTLDFSDYYLRHPTAPSLATADAPADFFQRHPELLQAVITAELGDWFQRHPESISR